MKSSAIGIATIEKANSPFNYVEGAVKNDKYARSDDILQPSVSLVIERHVPFSQWRFPFYVTTSKVREEASQTSSFKFEMCEQG